MTLENFEEIFQLIKDDVRKNTKMRGPIPPRLKFGATIRLLSAGESYKSLQFQFGIHILSVYSFQKFVLYIQPTKREIHEGNHSDFVLVV